MESVENKAYNKDRLRKLFSQTVSLNVTPSSDPKKIAGVIVKSMEEHHDIELTAVGSGSVNCAVKSIAIAKSYSAKDGIDLFFYPSFKDIVVSGENRTACVFKITYSK